MTINDQVYHTVDDTYIITYTSDAGDAVIRQQDDWAMTIVLDRIISLAIHQNLHHTMAKDLKTSLYLDVEEFAGEVISSRTWASAMLNATKRAQLMKKLWSVIPEIEVEDRMRIDIEGTRLFRNMTILSNYQVRIELEPYYLNHILSTSYKKPIYASASLYTTPSVAREHALYASKALLRYTQDSPVSDETGYSISVEQLIDILPWLKDTKAKIGNRRRSYQVWIQNHIKPAIDGCGIYKLVAATQHELWFKPSDEQLAVENRIKREGIVL